MALDLSVFCKETTTGEIIAGCFGSDGNTTYLDWILSAWGWTVKVAACAFVLALIVGSIMGIIRTLPNQRWLTFIGDAWTELFRNIPLLVQIFLWYFVLPAIFPFLKSFPPFVLVVFALGFFTSARISEQVRSGIQALPRGQRYAGMAVGFSTWQTYRHVLLPMAFRIIIPPLTSEAMNIVKNSSVAFAVSIAELTFFARQSAEETSMPIHMFLAVTLLYAITAFIVNRVMAWIEKRSRVPGFVSSGTGAAH